MRTKRTLALALLLLLILSTPAMALPKSTKVLNVAVAQLGKPYELSSDAPNSFNCASFVAYCFNTVKSGTITRNGVSGRCRKIGSMQKMKAGDIVCFRTSGSEKGILNYHFGLYMGKGRFIHASNSAKQVVISKLKSYSGRFLGALRVL